MEDLEEALSRARAGDRAAMGELYQAFASPLLSFLVMQTRRQQDAEDLLGEVFIAAMRDIGSFEGDPTGFRAWLYRIATNRAIDLSRRNRRRPEETLEVVQERVDEADPEADALAGLERARVRAAVRALPEEQRRVMALRLAGGLTASEIAQVIGKGTGAVKALQHRALVNLSRSLGPYPRDEGGRLDG